MQITDVKLFGIRIRERRKAEKYQELEKLKKELKQSKERNSQ